MISLATVMLRRWGYERRTVSPELMAAVKYDGLSGIRPPLSTRLTALGSELRNTMSITSPTCTPDTQRVSRTQRLGGGNSVGVRSSYWALREARAVGASTATVAPVRR